MSQFATQVTNYWCRSKGIKSEDLDTHPQIDDVMLLLKYRDGMWIKLNTSEQAHWGAIWDWTYHRKYPLKNKHLAKLELITIQAEQRHANKMAQINKARQKIRSLRPV
jgi:hypothetical protein